MSWQKRALDLFVSVPVFVLTLPLQIVAAVAIGLTMGTPVIFRQKRPGIHGEPFEMLKFRTMRPIDPVRGWTDDASRLTKVGQFLRSTSIDELPSLFNVIRGDLSLVGPRPLLMEYLELYSPEQARRHEVTPGLTGLAQVSGRNLLSWEDRLRLDVEYVDRQSIWLDLQILFQTVWAVVSRNGISEEGGATMSKFRGTRADLSWE